MALYSPRALMRRSMSGSCLSAIRQQKFYSTQDPSDELRLEHLTDKYQGITVMSINRPEAKNSISKNLLNLFEKAVETISKDNNTRVVILRSIVPGVFCAGADLKERRTMTEEDVPKFVTMARNAMQRLSELNVPTIVSLEGAALGGGLEMALACDLRVASSTAKLGLPETKLAIIPGAGGTVRLPRIISPALAKELIFTGRILRAADAERIGLVNYAVEQNENGDAAYQKALSLAQEIVPNGPLALRSAKMSINTNIETDIISALSIEETAYAQIIPTKDRVEGLNAFKEKRKPNYKGE